MAEATDAAPNRHKGATEGEDDDQIGNPNFFNNARIYRACAVGEFLAALLMFVLSIVLVQFKGLQGDNLSATLIAACFVGFAAFVVSVVDLVVTWKGTRVRTEPFTWNWEHENFKRAAAPAVLHAVFVWPTVLTFVLHNMGWEFGALLEAAKTTDPDTYDLMVWMIACFFFVFVTNSFNFVLVRRVIQKGYWNVHRMQNPGAELVKDARMWLCLGRMVGVVDMAAIAMFAVGVIRAADKNLNSGILTLCIINAVVSLLLVAMLVQSVFAAKKLTGQWWTKFRIVTTINLFVTYVAFWVILLQIALLNIHTITLNQVPSNNGYFDAISSMPGGRFESILFYQLGFFLLLLLFMVRAFYSKMRTKGRQQLLLAPLEATEGLLGGPREDKGPPADIEAPRAVTMGLMSADNLTDFRRQLSMDVLPNTAAVEPDTEQEVPTAAQQQEEAQNLPRVVTAEEEEF